MPKASIGRSNARRVKFFFGGIPNFAKYGISSRQNRLFLTFSQEIRRVFAVAELLHYLN